MDDDAKTTLDELQRLRTGSRRMAQAGSWFPTLLLADLLLLSIALYRHPFSDPGPDATFRPFWWFYPYWAGLPADQRNPTASYVFWFVGIPLVVLASGWWYRRRQRLAGVKVAWQWYALITLGALALLAMLAASPGPADTGEVSSAPGDASPFFRGLLTPLAVVAFAALALGWVERSRGLMIAGGWIAAVAGWQCTMGMGGLPAWAVWLLNGGSNEFGGGGQWTLFGLHRPGPTLILTALPLIAIAMITILRARRAA